MKHWEEFLMKQQWTLVFALLFALVIAIFSVINVEPVPVDYVFGTAQFPLIMVILGSALAGGFVSGLFGTIRMFRQNLRIRSLEKELQAMKDAAVPEPTPALRTPSGTSNPAAGDDTSTFDMVNEDANAK
jgi:putative membrane protein